MSDDTSAQPKHRYQRYLEQLPMDWECEEIRQLGTVVGGGTPSREIASLWRGSIPWVTPGELTGNSTRLIWDTEDHISASGLAGSGANLLPARSLMVTTRATLGARALNAVPMATNQGFKSIVFKQSADADFYFHLFEKVQPELMRRASGTTFLEISGTEFGSIKVPVPASVEKTLITQILDTLCAAIHETDAIIAKLQAVKQGLLHDLLTHGIDANGELRPLPAEAAHLYKQSPLGWIPKDWAVQPLESVVAQSPNAIVDGPFGSNLKTEHYRDTGIPVIQSGYVTSGKFVADHYVYITHKHFRSQSRSRVDPGDIVMAKIGANAGMCAVIPDDHPFGILAGNCLKITSDNSKATRSWLVRYLHRLYTTSGMSEVRTETAQPAISLGRIRKLLIPVPPLPEQRSVVDILSIADSAVLVKERELMKLGSFKYGLADDLLTGRVRVAPLLAQSQQ